MELGDAGDVDTITVGDVSTYSDAFAVDLNIGNADASAELEVGDDVPMDCNMDIGEVGDMDSYDAEHSNGIGTDDNIGTDINAELADSIDDNIGNIVDTECGSVENTMAESGDIEEQIDCDDIQHRPQATSK